MLLARIFRFVAEPFSHDASLKTLSRQLGYTASYLSRYFKEVPALSYITFVNRYKISKACYLLANTKKAILEISLDTGYPSLRSFNRNFKLCVGVTPKAYRQSIRNSDTEKGEKT